jgi:hypothetical protein
MPVEDGRMTAGELMEMLHDEQRGFELEQCGSELEKGIFTKTTPEPLCSVRKHYPFEVYLQAGAPSR